MDNVCADVVVGQEILLKHGSVTIVVNAPEESLTIASSVSSSSGHISVAVTKAEPQKLFEFLLPESKPVAYKSPRYSAEGTKFIKNEICHLLVAEIMEPARSPWRAQVQFVNQGYKKMLVIDYSATIYRFAILDVYQHPCIANLE